MSNSRVLKAVAALGLMASSLAAAVPFLVGVPSANPKSGVQPNIIIAGLELRRVAQGGELLENPSGLITTFGYLNDGPLTAPPPPPAAGTISEATKTEPDENTYLVLPHNPGGPTPGYDYGRHFLFQGHENANNLAYCTRINLDVHDADHRITLLTPVDPQTGKTGFNRIDGSSFNPFTRTMMFSQENGNQGGILEISIDAWPPIVQRRYGSIGQGGYEGIHADDWGNVYIAEDAGGTSVGIDPAAPGVNKFAKNPNSFIYRFVPTLSNDLSGGVLQALQVTIEGEVLKFVAVDGTHPTGDVFSDRQKKLHTTGTSWDVKWVDVHNTAVDGTAPFDANAAAKAAGATPFKRPENLNFMPGTGFRSFIFVPTGDTDKRSGDVPSLAERGAWGSVFRVDLDSPRKAGKIRCMVLGDAQHSSFDNVTFASENDVWITEDRGDNLHSQLNALDSIWAYDVSHAGSPGVRILALGRDLSSTRDSSYLDFIAGGGILPVGFVFQNEGDNEPTGIEVSDGADSIGGLKGRRLHPFDPDVRTFFTQQHGLNQVFEVVRIHGHGHE